MQKGLIYKYWTETEVLEKGKKKKNKSIGFKVKDEGKKKARQKRNVIKY